MTKKDLKQLYAEHTGKVSDKWSIYLAEYDHLFAPYRDRPVNLLEIGIQNGGSLEIWSKFFASAERIIGCDINPDCRKLQYADARIRVVVGDANTDDIERDIRQLAPNFDIVIDDGSHSSSDIIKSFARYFPRVTDGGIFVAEDLHCSYWADYEGGLFHPLSSIAFFKRLADVIAHEHWGVPKARSEVLLGFFSEYACSMDEQALAEIHSIEFINSICVVRKRPSADNELGRRIITRGTAEVWPVVQQLNDTLMAAPSQVANDWSQSDRLPEKVHLEQRREIAAIHAEAGRLKQAVAERDVQLAALNETIRLMTTSKSWRFTRPLRWLVQQQQRLREQGVTTRSKALARKIFKKLAGTGVAYVKARPALQSRLQTIAARLGMTQSLRKLYHRLQQRPNDQAAALRETVVASYSEWSARFDTPSPLALERLARTGDALMKPVGILATFDVSSAQQAPELARRLQASIGQPWTAVFLFTQGVDAEQVVQDVRLATKNDPRLSFDSTAAPPATDILVLIEGGALPRPHALRIFGDALRNASSSLLAYADEDRLIEGSTPADPWFKPEFSPLLCRQGMLLGRMLAVRDNGQDRQWTHLCTTALDMSDFGRRYALEAGASRVIHIPHVLFHDALPPAPPTELTLELPDELPLVSIVIPTRDRWDLLGACLESLRQTRWPADRLDIVVVDNGSTDAKTLKMLVKAEESGQIRVIRDDRQFNWSRLNNVAARDARGELLVFLNNDTEVNDPAWLRKLAAHALREETGAVGCKLLYEDRTVQHGGVIAGIQGVAGHAHLFLQPDAGGYRNLAITTHEVSAVTGACLAVTRQNFEAVGGFDENFRVAFNDVAFCFALHKQGKRNVYVSDPLFIHHESKSRGYDDTPEKQALQQAEARKAWARYADLMRADPFYSPNLSLWTPHELAFAPRRRAAWDARASRPLKVMMLSATHAIGHGVAVVVALQAEALVRQGYAVLVAGPRTSNDFPYPGCERVEVHDALSAATLAAVHSVDVIVAHTPPFFSVARWTGNYPPVIAYDYGEPPPDWFPDAAGRRAILAEKDQALTMATMVFAISDAIAAESRTPVNGVIPLGNAHLGQWTEATLARRESARARRGWQDKFVVLNVCRFHAGERRYKGVDIFADVHAAVKKKSTLDSEKTVFVLCGKGTPADVVAMEALGLTVAPNVTDEEMADLYCAADAYVNFSQWEGYNLGIGQALAMGLPTIASDIPAHRAFGIDVTNNIESAADWLLRCAANRPARTPKVWSWDAPCRQLIEVIESIAGEVTTDQSQPSQKITN